MREGKTYGYKRQGDAAGSFFLDEQPKRDLSEGDAFGHSHYSRTLLEILERTVTEESYCIGLFGRIGVGKTTIVNELERLVDLKPDQAGVRKYKYQFIKLDAWRFSEASFLREFLLDLAGELGQEEDLKKRLAKTVSVQHLEYRFPPAKTLAVGLILIAVMLGGAGAASHYLTSSQLWFVAALMGLLGGGMLTAMLAFVSEILKPIPVVEQVAPPVHPDEFGEAFRRLLRQTGATKTDGRLVVTIDNLDRVPGAIVMQILGAVKSILSEQHCIYILPCDELGLRRHVKEFSSSPGVTGVLTDSEAAEYLRKYFQITLSVRSLLQEDLAGFVDATLKRLPFLAEAVDQKGADPNKESRDAVALVFRVAAKENPRQILHLANRLAASYLLAEERSRESPRLRETVLGNLSFLAKLVVIEDRWPAFHEALLKQPDSIRQLQSYFRTQDVRLLPELFTLDDSSRDGAGAVRGEWVRGALKDFLRRTAGIQSECVSDFLLLKRRSASEKIANYYAFKDAAVSNDVDVVVRACLDEHTDVVLAVSELLSDLEDCVSRDDAPSCLSLLKCLVAVSSHAEIVVTGALRTSVAVRTAQVFCLETLAGHLLDVSLPELLDLVSSIPDSRPADRLVKRLVGCIDMDASPDQGMHVIQALISHPSLLGDDHKRSIAEALERGTKDAQRLTRLRTVAEQAVASLGRTASLLLPRSFWKETIAALAQPGESAATALALVSRYVEDLDSELTGEFCQTAVHHLQQVRQGGMIELALRIIDALPPGPLPSSAGAGIVNGLVGAYSAADTSDKRRAIVNAYFRLAPALSGQERSAFSRQLAQHISQCNAEDLVAVVSQLTVTLDVDPKPEDVVRAVRERAVALSGEPSVRTALYSLAAVAGSEPMLGGFARTLWTQPALGWKGERTAVIVVNELSGRLKREDFRTLVTELLDGTASLPAEVQGEALEALGSFATQYTAQFLNVLVDKLLNTWLVPRDARGRRAGFRLWKGVREKAVQERDRLHERVLELLKLSINANVVEEPEQVLVQGLRDDADLMDRARREELVAVALRLVEDGRPEQMRNYGHGLLQALASWKESTVVVPAKVLTLLVAQHDDKNMRNNLATMRAYGAVLGKKARGDLEVFLESDKSLPAVQDYLKGIATT